MDEWRKKVNDYSRDRKIIKSEIAMSRYKEHWYKMVSQKIKDNGIIESNSLIAQFMGYDIDDKNEFFSGLHYYKMDADSSDKTYDQLTIENVRSYTTDGFVWNYTDFTERRYDNSWDILMDVVEKIEKLDYVIIFHHNNCHIQTLKSYTNPDSDKDLWFIEVHNEKMMAVYEAVVQFIKFYNDKK